MGDSWSKSNEFMMQMLSHWLCSVLVDDTVSLARANVITAIESFSVDV